MMRETDVCAPRTEIKTNWATDLDPQNRLRESSHVIRKFINSAIYVEKPVLETVSREDISISQKCSNEDLMDVQFAKTKRCTCSVDWKTCPCHRNNNFNFPVSEIKLCSAISKTSTFEPKVKVSHAAQFSSSTEKDLVLKNWLARKEEEKKKKERKERMIMEAKMREKEALLQQKRDSYSKWLMNKKQQELEAKKKKQKELEVQQLRELEKEKKQLENQLNFHLWLRRKEEEMLEKKIKQHIELISEQEKKERQIQENEKAFNEWLKNSKNKQKPVPLNRGIRSLCSTTSVNYINPNPWNPAS